MSDGPIGFDRADGKDETRFAVLEVKGEKEPAVGPTTEALLLASFLGLSSCLPSTIHINGRRRDRVRYSHAPETKPLRGRNELCVCGSGKKYKKCCKR